MKWRSSMRAGGCAGVLILAALALADEKGRQPTSAPATQPTTLRSVEDLSLWLTYYYIHPAPDLVVPAVEMMAEQKLLSGESAAAPVSAFLAGVFRSHGGRVAGWLEELHTLAEAERQVLYEAAWRANDAECRAALERAAKSYPADAAFIREKLRETPPDLLTTPIQDPDDLDRLWGSFFATGDERYVVRLMSALPLVDEEDPMRVATGGAARWSLRSNALQHPRVLEICKAQLAEQPASVRKYLEEIVSKAASSAPAQTGVGKKP